MLVHPPQRGMTRVNPALTRRRPGPGAPPEASFSKPRTSQTQLNSADRGTPIQQGRGANSFGARLQDAVERAERRRGRALQAVTLAG